MTKMPALSTPRLSLRATCACGAVAVRLDGAVRIMLLCACQDCQKSSGSGHAAVAFVEANEVGVTGEVTDYARPAESGAVLTRRFCPRCGTPIFSTSSRAARFVMLPAGLFAGQNDWFRPTQMIFARTHQDWDAIAADLPQYLTYRDAAGTRDERQ
jgi:hypothetical protein